MGQHPDDCCSAFVLRVLYLRFDDVCLGWCLACVKQHREYFGTLLESLRRHIDVGLQQREAWSKANALDLLGKRMSQVRPVPHRRNGMTSR